MRGYNNAIDHRQKSPSEGTRFVKVPSVDKYRRMCCFTYVSTGSCAYGSRCVFLHDPRVQCYSEGEIRLCSTKQKPYGSTATKDTFYWPDMDKGDVSRSVDAATGLPACAQPYTIPASFKEHHDVYAPNSVFAGTKKREDMHNFAIYSTWNHFVKATMLVGSHHRGDEIKGAVDKEWSEDKPANSVAPDVQRLPVFMQLSRGKSLLDQEQELHELEREGRRVKEAPLSPCLPMPLPTSRSQEQQEEEEVKEEPREHPLYPFKEPVLALIASPEEGTEQDSDSDAVDREVDMDVEEEEEEEAFPLLSPLHSCPKQRPVAPRSFACIHDEVPSPAPAPASWVDACGKSPTAQAQAEAHNPYRMHARGLSLHECLDRLGPSVVYEHQPHYLGSAMGPDWFSEAAVTSLAVRKGAAAPAAVSTTAAAAAGAAAAAAGGGAGGMEEVGEASADTDDADTEDARDC